MGSCTSACNHTAIWQWRHRTTRSRCRRPYSSANLVLVGPRIDLTFTDNLFLTTNVQYNNQINNLNVNIRLQWRFAPVSDLFVVYSDNSYPEDFENKNRGLAIKISYWFN